MNYGERMEYQYIQRHRINHAYSYLSSFTGLILTHCECETGFILAVLFSELLCVHSCGRELLWPSVLLSVLRIGSEVQRTSRLPAFQSPPPTLLFTFHIRQNYI